MSLPNRYIVDQDIFLAVLLVARDRHLRQRLAVGADEPGAAGPVARRALAFGRVELRTVEIGVIVEGGVDLHLRDPSIRPRPGRAELVPPGRRAAGAVGVRAVDDLGPL